MANTKVTQVYAELAASVSTKVRVTQIYTELAASKSTLVRVTQVYAELAASDTSTPALPPLTNLPPSPAPLASQGAPFNVWWTPS